jgi:hypothetical protein
MTTCPDFFKRSEKMKRVLVSASVLVAFLCFLRPEVTFSQSPQAEKPTLDAVLGKYEGVIKADAAEIGLTLEISNDQGKLAGRLVTPHGDLLISEGTFSDGKLSLKLRHGEAVSTLSARLQGEMLVGEWSASGQVRPLELKRVSAAAEKPVAAVASEGFLNGDWEGLAATQGEDFPFLLTLKVEGEKVTGQSSSSLGTASISNGSFKDGKLAIQLDSQGATIQLTAILKDSELVGEYDFAGQSQGRWVAKKKNP